MERWELWNHQKRLPLIDNKHSMSKLLNSERNRKQKNKNDFWKIWLVLHSWSLFVIYFLCCLNTCDIYLWTCLKKEGTLSKWLVMISQMKQPLGILSCKSRYFFLLRFNFMIGKKLSVKVEETSRLDDGILLVSISFPNLKGE